MNIIIPRSNSRNECGAFLLPNPQLFVDKIMAIMRIRFIGASPYVVLCDPDGVINALKGQYNLV
jgi:hypothetical protein